MRALSKSEVAQAEGLTVLLRLALLLFLIFADAVAQPSIQAGARGMTMSLNRVRSSHTSAAYNGHLHVVGGIDSAANEPPAILSFSPQSGPVGTIVTITGTNFNPTASNDVVYFGAVKAEVTAATSSSLSVTIPYGAVYAPITMTDLTTGLTAFSSKPFIVTFQSREAMDSLSFDSHVDFKTGSSPNGVALGDLDGDGKPDLVVTNRDSQTVSIFMNTSVPGPITASSFAPNVDFTTRSDPWCVVISDVNGDGKPDLLVMNRGNNTVSIFRNVSTSGSITASSFSSGVVFETGSRPTCLTICDVDGDGKPDLVVSNFYSNTVSVFRNISVPDTITADSFAPRVDFTTGANPVGVDVGDVDGDGKPDLAVINSNDNSISVFRNISTPGNISFAPRIDFVTGTYPNSIIAGDMDGDGKPDLVITNSNDNTISVFRNTSTPGSISLAPKADFTAGRDPFRVAIGDMDGDGKPDLVVTNNGGDNTVSIFKNKSTPGNISFAPRVEFETGVYPFGVAVGDVDGDGRPDLVVTNADLSSTVSVLRNIISIGNTRPAAPQNLTANSGDAQVTLKWSKNSEPDILRYLIYRGTSPGSETLIDSSSASATDTTRVMTGLKDGTTYYFKVTAIDSARLESAFSNEVSAVPLGSVKLVSPANGSHGSPINPTLMWNAADGATHYRVQVSTDSTFATTIYDTSGIAGTTRGITGLAFLTSYYWRVSASTEGGTGGWSAVWTFMTHGPEIDGDVSRNGTVTAFDAALILGYLVGDTTLTQLELSAADVSGDGAVTALDASLILRYVAHDTSVHFATSARGHRFEVSSANSYGTISLGQASSDGSDLVSVPVVIDDARNVYAVELSLSIGQAVNVEGVSGNLPKDWMLFYRVDNDVLKIAIAGVTPLPSGSLATIKLKVANGFAKSQVTGSSVINENARQTLATVEVKAIPAIFALSQNYPNPFNPVTSIRFEIPSTQHVYVTVYDALGRKVRSLMNADVSPGYYEIPFDGTTLSSGVYFYRLSAGSFNQVKKMILLK